MNGENKIEVQILELANDKKTAGRARVLVHL